jgi:Cu/Ag efflux pump CusA
VTFILHELEMATRTAKVRIEVANTDHRIKHEMFADIMVGAAERVRPKMMTVIATMAALLPMLWTQGTGSEVMQRMAVPMFGGVRWCRRPC